MQLPFLKKKEQPTKTGIVPLDRVRELSGRGFSESEMIDILRKEGYNAQQIDEALAQSLRAEVAGTQKPAQAPAPSMPALPTMEELTPKAEMPEIPESPLPQEYSQQYPTEDYIDYIVQARVAEVSDKVNEFSIRYQELEKRMESISEQLSEIMRTRSGEQQQILERIDSFGETINDVNVRVGSLEKVFKETLPALIESVRALSDLVQRMKREA